MIYCKKHKSYEKIVEYRRDTPILSCGCSKEVSKDDRRLEECKNAIEKFALVSAIEQGITVDEAKAQLMNWL